MAKIYALIFILFFTGNIFAQNSPSRKKKNRKTIGLVLSGGGAKGFAHIGAIKLLEECGIKPDYITGTSMGSIVGALYAMGYTAEEMTQVSDTTNWTMVLSNTVPLTEITVAEKPYYGTFLTELDIKKTGVSLPGGLIEGQNLLDKLSVLTRPVHGIENFLDFPIPFTCVATDIVKGEAVALSRGNITEAIRASMAIPTAFTPVEFDGMLLVDGGWTRNLPVQEAKNMGADIIISVDVGAPLHEREELESMVAILDQTMWILSVHDTKKQLEMSDFVISPPVSHFSTFDFDKADTIIASGYAEAAKQRDAFIALAKRIYPTGKYEGEIKKPFYEPKYIISNISVTGNNLTSKKFVGGRLSLKTDTEYSAEEIKKRVDLLYGSLYYKKIDFQMIPMADSTQELVINVVEDNPSKLKLSFYYDTENSVGININLTLRNLLFKNSRFIFDGYASENPIFELKYIKYVGENQNAFVFYDARYTKDSRFQWTNYYDQEAGYNYRELLSHAGIIYTIKNQLMVGGSVGYQAARMKPTTNPDTVVDYWSQSAFPINAIMGINTLDKAVFPTKGTKVWAYASFNFNISQYAHLKPGFTDFTQETADDRTAVDPYIMFKFGIQKYFPVSKKVSFYADAHMTMSDKSKIGFNNYSKIGGISPILFSSTPFWGAKRNEVSVTQYAILSAGIQWQIFGDLYFKGKVNYLNTEYPMSWFSEFLIADEFNLYGNTYTHMFGFGAELAYNTPLGPLRFTLHQNQYSDKLNVFVSFGYNINKSEGQF